jgi:hypothetical protein
MVQSEAIADMDRSAQRYAVAVLLFGLAANARAQQIVRWNTTDPNSAQRWEQGLLYKRIGVSSLVIETELHENNGRFVATIGVLNRRESPVDVLPTRFTIQITDPPGRELPSIAPAKLLAKPSIWDAIAAGAAGAQEGLNSTRQRRTASATVTNPDGSTSHVDVYQPGPTPEEDEQARQRERRSQAQAADRARYNQGVLGAALVANTLEPQKVIYGTVFFPREKKKYREVDVRVRVDDIVFEFPYAFQHDSR